MRASFGARVTDYRAPAGSVGGAADPRQVADDDGLGVSLSRAAERPEGVSQLVRFAREDLFQTDAHRRRQGLVREDDGRAAGAGLKNGGQSTISRLL